MSRRSFIVLGVVIFASGCGLAWALYGLPSWLAIHTTGSDWNGAGTTSSDRVRAISNARTAAVAAVTAFLVLVTGAAAWMSALVAKRSALASEERGWSKAFERGSRLLGKPPPGNPALAHTEQMAGAYLLGTVATAAPALRDAVVRSLTEWIHKSSTYVGPMPDRSQFLGLPWLHQRTPIASATFDELLRLSSLKDRNAEAIELTGLDLRKSVLTVRTHRSVTFAASIFDGAKMSGSRFSNCIFRDCRFFGARAVGAVFINCEFSRAEMRGFDLQGARFIRCRFLAADLRRVNLSRSSFLACSFEGAEHDGPMRWLTPFLNAKISRN
jgi:hypothetical protein